MRRLRYFTRRVVETPPQALARKAWLRVKPYVYAPFYSSRRAGNSRPASHTIERVMSALSELPPTPHPTGDVAYRKRATDRAASVAAGRFPVLGYGETDIPSGSGWLRDPFHGYEWPCSYFPAVGFLSGAGRADVKIPWELSRLQFLVWLAEGALFDGSEGDTYVARFEAILHDWNAANPTGFGVNWTCGMEVAIRSVNLVFAAALITDRLSAGSQAALVGCLFAHRSFLRRFPEYSDVTGNHYLAGLMGIAVLESVLSGLQSRAFRQAVFAFTAEAERQFEPSGAHLEYAPVYHRLCMDMVAVVHAVASRAGNELAVPLSRVLERAMAFADSIASPGGVLPIFGDSDSGEILSFGADVRRLDSMRAYCHGAHAGDPHGDLAVFLNHFRESEEPLFPAAGSRTRNSGPFAAMRNGPITVIARHGPHGLKGRAPHDHDDALGIWVFVGDDDLLVDVGCVGYTLNWDERRATVVSTGHPVWSPSGAERYIPVQGSIALTVRGAPTAEVQLEENADATICRLELRGPLRVSLAERRWIILSDTMRIEDSIRLREPHAIEMLLRVGPAFRIEASRAENAVGIRHLASGHRGELQFQANQTLELAVEEEMWAPQYGRKEKISALRVRSPAASEHVVCWTLAWKNDEARDAGGGLD
ncbi:MAG: heparinase II/III family protein [Bacillota bacterium]